MNYLLNAYASEWVSVILPGGCHEASTQIPLLPPPPVVCCTADAPQLLPHRRSPPALLPPPPPPRPSLQPMPCHCFSRCCCSAGARLAGSGARVGAGGSSRRCQASWKQACHVCGTVTAKVEPKTPSRRDIVCTGPASRQGALSHAPDAGLTGIAPLLITARLFRAMRGSALGLTQCSSWLVVVGATVYTGAIACKTCKS